MKNFLKKIASKPDFTDKVQTTEVCMCLLGGVMLLAFWFFGQGTSFGNVLFFSALIIIGTSFVLGILHDVITERYTNKKAFVNKLSFWAIFLVIVWILL